MQNLEKLQDKPEINKEAISNQVEEIDVKRKQLTMLTNQNMHLDSVRADIQYLNRIFDIEWLDMTKNLWMIPENILIIILIFSMGTLGSLIFFNHGIS